jgi:aminopeptidase YwaD
MERASSTTAYRNQVNNAVNAGAVGVILYSLVGSRGNYGSAFSPSLSSSNPAKDNGVPVLGAALIQGIWLKEMLDQGPVTLSLKSKQYTNLQSLNVIGIKPANNGDPDAPAILVTGHMDSVVGAPGANDNASGVALALELGRVLKSYNTDKELRFIAFGSEERGLVGANYYVNDLTDDERARIMAVFNGDMVATSYVPANPYYAENFYLYAMTVNGLPNMVTDGAVAAGARLGNSSILPGRFSSSDHVPFHNRGIPAALFIWMFWESTSVYDIEKVYHTPQDTIEENVSLDRMQTALEIIGAAVFDVVRKDVPALEESRIRSAEGF